MARLSLVAAVSLSISGCSLLQGVYPTGDDVIAQATPGSEIAFDVVKVSDAVVTTLDAHQPPPFHQRFKPYEPAPELKIAVGDILSTVVWESSPEGLFGYSLRQLGGTGAGQIAEASSVALRNPTVTSVTAPSLETAPQSNTAISALALEQAAGTQAATNRGRGLDLSDIAAARAANQFAAERNANAIASSIAAGSLFGGARAAVPDQSAEYHAGTTIPDQVVGPDGTITIPYGGAISVVGRTPAEVQRSVEERLTGKALQPQALVVIKQSLANSVSISGSAVPGKRVTLGPGGSRLLDVIAAAGQARAPVRTSACGRGTGPARTAPTLVAVQRAERGDASHRLPGWLVYTVLRVLVFLVPLVVTLLLGAGPLLASVIAAIVGLCLSLLFLSGSRGRYSRELAALRGRPGPATERTDDEVAEDSAADAVDGQNASAAAKPKP